MTRIDQQGSSLGLGPIFPFSNPYYNPTFGPFALCQFLSVEKLRQINLRLIISFTSR